MTTLPTERFRSNPLSAGLKRLVAKTSTALKAKTLKAFLASELATPAFGLVSCLVLFAGLIGLQASGLTKDSWTLVTAQSLIKVDDGDFNIDSFKIRVSGQQQLDLEFEQAVLLSPKKGELYDNLHCVAQNIYFEARNQPTEGKIAVGHVVLNRVASRSFPNSACEVVRQGGEVRKHRCQFSWWCDGKSDEPENLKAWYESMELARDVVWGRAKDPTEGALWYHADYVSPSWSSAFDKGPTIGHHIFYSRKPAPERQQVAEAPASQ